MKLPQDTNNKIAKRPPIHQNNRKVNCEPNTEISQHTNTWHMSNLKHHLINNGFFVPRKYVAGQDIVYDKNSEIVEESCILRGENKSENVTNPPQRFPDVIKKKAGYVNDRLLFMGQFMREHYGHFLTEGISRYWYILQDTERNWRIPTPNYPFGIKKFIKAHLYPNRTQWKAVMKSFGLSRKNILYITDPIQAQEIIVPQCSMYNRYQIYMPHLQVTRKVAKDIIGSSHIGRDSTPVYLSRTKLNKKVRNYVGEELIEDYCREVGCKIVYPERLSLKQQIILFNRHDTFIGCIGAAFHTLLYRVVNTKAVNIYLATQSTNPNYALIDNLMQNRSYYVYCVDPVPGKIRTLQFDDQKAVDGINQYLFS